MTGSMCDQEGRLGKEQLAGAPQGKESKSGCLPPRPQPSECPVSAARFPTEELPEPSGDVLRR